MDVEYYEYDCGTYCTADGCPGHSTDVPVSIVIDDVCFTVQGYENRDYPGNVEEVEKVKKVIEKLNNREKIFNELLENWSMGQLNSTIGMSPEMIDDIVKNVTLQREMYIKRFAG